MKTHVEIKRFEKVIVRAVALMMLALMAAQMIPAQAPVNPAPPPENILAGALIIPMDNVNQGNAGGTTFNLRAYGLANLLLQNDIPVKWAIKPGKSKDDVDFSATVTRVAGSAGVPGSANVSFSGGPFVIAREYNNALVLNLISTFNGGGTPVTVYETDADALIDIRYTLTHKPKIAVGPDGGDFGPGVFQGLFDRAGIPNYVTGVDNIDTAGACFTLATQGHQEDPTFVTKYRNFVQNNGNLILQCASIPTFENHASGHFQTTVPGYNVFTSNPPTPNETNSNAFNFPEGYMPFNQFIGLLADQDGEVTEYSYALGAGAANGNRVAAENTGADAGKFVATVSQVNGPNANGGVVFEMGSHNYARLDTGETDTELAMLNGQRMQLNAVFVPATTICVPPTGSIIGYKSVRRFNVRQGGPSELVVGDVAIWTIDYINNSQATQFDFQITDLINEFTPELALAAFSPGVWVQVNEYGVGTDANPNQSFNGVGITNLLQPGAVLPPGGRIQVKILTTITNAPNNLVPCPDPLDPKKCVYNQATASSASIPASATTKTDGVDATNAAIFSQDPPPLDSFDQFQNLSIINNTLAPVVVPTAAEVSVEGRAVDVEGNGLRNVLVIVRDGSTGQARSIRTNEFGVFRIEGLEAGRLYIISAQHKRFVFGEPMVVTLGESMTGLAFTGTLDAFANPEKTTKK